MNGLTFSKNREHDDDNRSKRSATLISEERSSLFELLLKRITYLRTS